MGNDEISQEVLQQAAVEVRQRARERDLGLKVVGGIGIRMILAKDLIPLYDQTRTPPRDVDVLVPKKTSKEVGALFTSLGYTPNERLIAWHGETRHVYDRLDEEGSSIFHFDVFLGSPPVCHPVRLREPIVSDRVTLSMSDLLLLKLQIVKMTEKDLTDIAFLLLSTDALDSGESSRDAEHVLEHLGADWGFFHTATTNLRRLLAASQGLTDERLVPNRSQANRIIQRRAQSLLDVIDATPKTRRWRLRSKVGTRVQWYTDVEDVER